MRLNGIIGAEIPYYKMMNKAMPGPAKDTKRKPKNGRLTEIDPKTNKPRLKSGVPISRAVESFICLKIRTYCLIRLRK